MGRSTSMACSYRCTQRSLKYALISILVCLFFISAIVPLLPRHVQLQPIRQSTDDAAVVLAEARVHAATLRRINNIKNKVDETRQSAHVDADPPSHSAPIAAKSVSPLSVYPRLQSNSTPSTDEDETIFVPLSMGFSPPRCPQQAWWPLDSQGRPFDPDVEASRERLLKRRSENSTDADVPVQQMHAGFGVPPIIPFQKGATRKTLGGAEHSWYRPESSTRTPLQEEILSLPFLPLATSSFALAMLPFPFWQSRGEFDTYSSTADLTWVAFHRGLLHIYGTETWDEAERKQAAEVMPRYKHMKGKWETKPTLADQVQFHNGPLDIHTCDEIIEESTFFHSSWISTSMYNSHNDNLLPVFSNLRSVGGLHSDAKRRLYLWKSDDFDKRVPWMTLLNALFQDSVFDASEELMKEPASSKRKCFRHIRWGRGPLMGYVRDAVPFSKDCTNLDHLYPFPHETLFQDSHQKIMDKRVDDSAVDLATQDRRLRFLHGQGVIAGDAIAFHRHWLEYFKLVDVEAVREMEKKPVQAAVVRGVKRLIITQEGATFDEEETKKKVVNTGARINRLISGERRDLILDPLSHGELMQCVLEQKYPRIVFMDRFGDNRRIENADQFIQLVGRSRTLGGLELNVTRCCEWDEGLAAGAEGGPRALKFLENQIQILQQADIIIGFNGASLALQLYIPPGAVIVELQGEGYIHNQLFNRLARWMDHLHLNIDVRKHFRSMALPYVFPDTTSYEVVSYALNHWKRNYPCHAHEEVERADFYDKSKHSFLERFSMGDPRGDRKELVNWSMLDD